LSTHAGQTKGKKGSNCVSGKKNHLNGDLPVAVEGKRKTTDDYVKVRVSEKRKRCRSIFIFLAWGEREKGLHCPPARETVFRCYGGKGKKGRKKSDSEPKIRQKGRNETTPRGT